MREPAWRNTGAHPDDRFTLGNERTFLAWIRTAPALPAGGVPPHRSSAGGISPIPIEQAA